MPLKKNTIMAMQFLDWPSATGYPAMKKKPWKHMAKLSTPSTFLRLITTTPVFSTTKVKNKKPSII